MIDDDLYTLLTGNASITTAFTGGIHNDAALKGAARPHLVFSLVGGEGQYDLDGIDPWRTARVQFDVIADTAASRVSLVNTLDTALNDYAGAMGSRTVHQTTQENIQNLTEVDGDKRRFRASIDYLFAYE